MKKNKIINSFSNRKFKMGSFQTIIMVIVVIVVVVLNILVTRLGVSKDMNSDFLYSLSDDTVSFASDLKDDIILYYLVEDGNEAVSAANTKVINIENIIKLYDRFEHIQVEKKNPVLYPNFAKEYTEETVADNDVIVVNKKNNKSQYVSFQKEMIEYGYDTSNGGYQQIPQTLKLESAITSAIQKVTLQNTKKVYVTNDHGEQPLGDEFYDLLSKNGMEHEEFLVSKNTEIPKGCDLLIMNSPANDLTNKEYQYVSDYLKEGGKALFFLNYTADTPNYDKLLKEYGIDVKKGLVLDPEDYFASYGSGMYMLLTPTLSENSVISEDKVGQANTLAWYSKGMTADKKVRGSLTTESILKTSEKAYCKKLEDVKNENLDASETDEKGPFSVAMTAVDTHAEDTKGKGHATKLFVVGSVAFTSIPNYSNSAQSSLVSIIGDNQYGNRNILVNALTWLVGDAGEEIAVLNIPDRSLLVDYVTINDGDVKFFTTLLLGIVPISLLFAGFVVWNRRRKK